MKHFGEIFGIDGRIGTHFEFRGTRTKGPSQKEMYLEVMQWRDTLYDTSTF